MVIVKIQGGLGNQLFQYSAARALALLRKTEVKLDTSIFTSTETRELGIWNFNVNCKIATASEIKILKAQNSFRRILEKVKPYSKKSFYKQPFFHFDNKFFNLPQDVYLSGYFQSELYFKPALEVISAELKLKDLLIKNVKHLSESFVNENSIAIHIRKGDYMNKNIYKVHGILTHEYYERAIDYMQQNVRKPMFYIFTDDPFFSASEIGLDKATIVSGNFSKTPYEDLFLMSKCKHNIIANSSFSWWGAWLNSNPLKIVIAPSNWFHKGPKDTQDLFSKQWITL